MSSQPDPINTGSQPIWNLVIADMRERDRVGRATYGTPLTSDNGRDHLQDAYEEALDLAAYLKAEIIKRDKAKGESQ